MSLVARLNREVNALVNTPEVADRLANDTVEPKALSPEATAEHVADEIRDGKPWRSAPVCGSIDP